MAVIGQYSRSSLFENEYRKSIHRRETFQAVTFSNLNLRIEALKMCIVHTLSAPFSSAYITCHFAKNFFHFLGTAYQDPSYRLKEPFSKCADRYFNRLLNSGRPLVKDFAAVLTFPFLRVALIAKELLGAIVHPAFAYKRYFLE